MQKVEELKKLLKEIFQIDAEYDVLANLFEQAKHRKQMRPVVTFADDCSLEELENLIKFCDSENKIFQLGKFDRLIDLSVDNKDFKHAKELLVGHYTKYATKEQIAEKAKAVIEKSVAEKDFAQVDEGVALFNLVLIKVATPEVLEEVAKLFKPFKFQLFEGHLLTEGTIKKIKKGKLKLVPQDNK